MKSNKGFTLIELLMSLGVITVLTAAIFWAWPPIQADMWVKQERDKSLLLFDKLNRLVGDEWQTHGIDNAFVINAQIVEPEDLTSAWGGVIEIRPANSNGSTGGGCDINTCNRFAIFYRNVPKRVCAKLAKAMESNSGRIIVAPDGSNVNVKMLPSMEYNPTLTATTCGQNSVIQYMMFSPK